MSTAQKETILPTLEKLKADGEIDPLSTLVYTALGAASACWDNLSGAGVFESDRCKKIGDELMAACRSSPAEPVAWQFFQDGKWYNGFDHNDHRKNTEEAGYPVRELYAHPPIPKEASKQLIQHMVNELKNIDVLNPERTAERIDTLLAAVKAQFDITPTEE